MFNMENIKHGEKGTGQNETNGLGCEIPTLVRGTQGLGKGQGVEKTKSPLHPCSHTSERGAKECKPVGKTHPQVLAKEAQKHKALSAQQTLSELRAARHRHGPHLGGKDHWGADSRVSPPPPSARTALSLESQSTPPAYLLLQENQQTKEEKIPSGSLVHHPLSVKKSIMI